MTNWKQVWRFFCKCIKTTKITYLHNQIKSIYIALRTSADISKCCTETQPKTPNSKQCRCRSTVVSRSDLYFLCFVFSSYGQGVSWVGSLCLFFYVLVISMFRPSMVLNQRQVSLVVSDWESYLCGLGFTVCLWVIVSCLCVCTR